MDTDTLYQLRPSEFERLSAQILKAQGFQSVEVVGGPSDQGVDIVANAEGCPVVVQVKHARRLYRNALREITERLRKSPYGAQKLVVVTSAPITPADRAVAEELSADGVPVRLIGQAEVLATLADNPAIEQAFVPPARTRFRRQRIELFIGLIAALISIFAFITGRSSLFRPLQPPLDRRIETVEHAIGSLKDLEQYLTDIKGDMVDTERAVRAVEEEYAKAKELEKLTEAQFAAVKSALRLKTRKETILNYVLGFVLGVASSLTASVIWSWWRQYRALTR